MYHPTDVTETFVINIGVLLRWKIVADIKTIAREQGLAIVSEHDGWAVRFDVTGARPDVERFVQAIYAVQKFRRLAPG